MNTEIKELTFYVIEMGNETLTLALPTKKSSKSSNLQNPDTDSE